MAISQQSTVTQLKDLRDQLLGDMARGIATVTDQNGESVTYTSPTQILIAIRELEKRISSIENASRTRPAGIYPINANSGF